MLTKSRVKSKIQIDRKLQEDKEIRKTKEREKGEYLNMKMAENLVALYIYIDILLTTIASFQVHKFQYSFLKLVGFINKANKKLLLYKIE